MNANGEGQRNEGTKGQGPAREPPLIEGNFYVCRPSAESLRRGEWPPETLALFKGDEIIGLIAPHLCGETCFFADARTPALRSETLDLIARVIDDFPSAWKTLRLAEPRCSIIIEYRPVVVARAHLVGMDASRKGEST